MMARRSSRKPTGTEVTAAIMLDLGSVWEGQTPSSQRFASPCHGDATTRRGLGNMLPTPDSSPPPEDKHACSGKRAMILLAAGSTFFVGGLLVLHVYAMNVLQVGDPEVNAVQGEFPDHPIIRDASFLSEERMRAVRIRPSEEKALEAAAQKREQNMPGTDLEKQQQEQHNSAPSRPSDTTHLCAYRNLQTALRSTAINKRLFLQVIPDHDHIPLARNNYQTIKKKTGASNVLFVCTRAEQCETMSNHGIPCYLDSENAADNGTALSAFSNVYTALRFGYQIIYMNFEVSIMRDPKQEIDILSPTADMILPHGINPQSNSFYIANAAMKTISFHKDAMQRASVSSGRPMSHQDIFQKVLTIRLRTKRIQVQSVFTCQSIPPHKDCPITRHYYMATAHERILWLKEKHMWFIDDNGYYSSLFVEYVSYANNINMGNRSEVDQIHALKNALAIGQVLNRTVILPKFLCWRCKRGSCRSNSCLLSAILDMKYFDRIFKDRYREQSFRGHPLVPGTVRRNVSAVIVFRSPLLRLVEALHGSSIHHPPTPRTRTTFLNVEETPSSEEIHSMLGHYNYKILQIGNMYGAFSGFTDALESLEFERKLKAGIVLKSDKKS